MKIIKRMISVYPECKDAGHNQWGAGIWMEKIDLAGGKIITEQCLRSCGTMERANDLAHKIWRRLKRKFPALEFVPCLLGPFNEQEEEELL